MGGLRGFPVQDTPFARLAASRRTVHRFEARPVPEAAVRRAAHLATCAPNHKLTEPWTFVLLGPQRRQAVIDRAVELFREKLGDEAAAKRRVAWEAVPAYVAVLSRRTPSDPLREREDYAAVSAAAYAFALALWEDGIGTKWTTGPVTRDDAFLRLIGSESADALVVGLFMLGYPAEVPSAPPRTRADVFRVTE